MTVEAADRTPEMTPALRHAVVAGRGVITLAWWGMRSDACRFTKSDRAPQLRGPCAWTEEWWL